eukprot:PhM_4_TR14387/c0_g1_i1/m.60982
MWHGKRLLMMVCVLYAVGFIVSRVSWLYRTQIIVSPAAPREQSSSKGTIFVNIASYRDHECSDTILDLFARADDPENIFVGVVQQHAEEDGECLAENRIPPHIMAHVNVFRQRPTDALGPADARQQAHSRFFSQQEFYLMIDSHTRFKKHWDSELKRMLALAKRQSNSGKAILSHYPEGYHNSPAHVVSAELAARSSSYALNTTSVMCYGFFVEGCRLIRFTSGVIPATPQPMLSRFLAAGMMFTEANLFNDVPLDPNLPYLFDGEEMLLTIRSWTFGWDIFSPSHSVLFHRYLRPSSPKIFDDLEPDRWFKIQRQSMRKAERIIFLDRHLLTSAEQHYGLGRERTMDAFFKFAKIDVKSRQIENTCPHLDWALKRRR